MITPFFRSSLLNCFSLCPLRCFLEYSIGLRGGSNHSALIGSTVHGVMEILALAKLAQQNNKSSFTHESFNLSIDFDTKSTLEMSIGDLLNISYDYYDKENPGIFTDKSYDECLSLVNKALSFQNKTFDPRHSLIYAAELPFEIEIPDKWAEYYYTDNKNNLIKGKLALKGTIDLILKEDDNTLICLDYKTGKGLMDWATGKEKDERSLYYDQQLMLYYYVLAHTFPDKDIIMILYFIRLDKAFTIIFDRKKDLSRIKLWIKERFEYIKSVEKPTWIDGTKDGWKCRWCPFNTEKQKGTKLSICKFYQKEFQKKSMKEIMLKNADFSTISSYGHGGSHKERE